MTTINKSSEYHKHDRYSTCLHVSAPQTVDCCVVRRTGAGFDVELLPSRVAAFLPRVHLSDYADVTAVLWKSLRPGDGVSDVMYTGNAAVIVSFLRRRATRRLPIAKTRDEKLGEKRGEKLELGQMVSISSIKARYRY